MSLANLRRPARRLAVVAAALVSCVVVAGCVTGGPAGGRDDAVCTGQGFQAGTADYTACRSMLANQRRDDALVARSEYFSD